MNEPTLLDLILEYGRTMDMAARDDVLGNAKAGHVASRAERLYDEIERRLKALAAEAAR